MALCNDYIHIIVNLDETKDIYFFNDKLKGKQKIIGKYILMKIF